MLSPKWLSGQGWGFGASAFAGRIPLSPDSDANGSPADGAGAPTPGPVEAHIIVYSHVDPGW